MNRLLCLMTFSSAMLCAVHGEEGEAGAAKKDAPAATPAKAGKAKYGPRDVEIELRGKSKLRGELVGEFNFVLETSFGKLQIPCEEMIGLRRCAGENAPDAGAPTAAKDSDSNAAPRPAAGCDTVEALKMKARGALQTTSFTLRSKLGELNFNLSDITAIRWLCWGKQKTLELKADEAMSEWVDTGIDTRPDEPIAVACSGEISFWGNMVSTPNGCPNWNNGGPFLMGAVIGRLGEGEPFLLGAEKTWNAEGSQRLYVKIYSNQNFGRGNQITGQYKMTISVGVLPGEKSE